MYPINNVSSLNMKLVNTIPNAKHYWVTVPHDGGNTTSGFDLIHVWGTPYEMGYAQGSILKPTLSVFMQDTWEYLQGEVDAYLGDLPKWLQDWIADFGLDSALDLTKDATEEYTPQYFYDELKGLSDGCGVDYNLIVRVHMIASLTQGACSAFGAWGEALAPGYKLLQLRALDWNMDGPFKNFPSVTVYHPNEGNGHPFMTASMQGYISGLSGASANLAVSEIGVGYPDDSFGSESRFGIPFIFLLRDILQWDECLDDATNRMINAKRTCDLILGVGDANLGEFRGYQYSSSVLNVMNDENLKPDNDTWHPKFTDIVYWGMDWECPSYNYILSGQFKKYYGQITPEIAIRYLTPIEKSGDNFLAYYDLPNGKVYLSFAKQTYFDGPENAYDRQFSMLDLPSLWAETPPTGGIVAGI
eukprot:TRINITY_DN1212_c0_g1_i1.p1 TRINITY_DN1212_c0_g1~~TRINITY_DN1212_c0_g1_i1.p1  ORF type:complete len:416 (+),score=120.87 TRINITY_DN1212_c0_g1_i1:278-1525(+)